MLNVLLVEDDLDLAATVVDFLEFESMSCDHAANGVAGLTLIEKHSYSVIILDINLPKMDGLSVCEQLRARGIDTPVLMLTARDSLRDKVAGFNAGTDDYLVKPFEIEELVVRLQALAKRRSGQLNQLAVAGVVLDLQAKAARRGERAVKLTPITFKLLESLMRASPNPVSRASLMQAVWGDEQPDSNSLKVHMHHLRKQLDGADEPRLIQTVTGFGFCLAGA